MQSREVKQYNNVEKSSDSSNCSDVGRKYQTHEERCWNFKRFLTPLASGEKGEASKNSLQGKAQEIYDGEALSELREQGKPLSSNEKKIVSLQARKEEVKANRKLLEHVWSSVPRRELATDTTSIIFVHGMTTDGKGDNCADYWGDAKTFLQKNQNWKGDLHTIQYYTADKECDVNFLDSKYRQPCANYQADAKLEGTDNESIYHISCKLAQYLYQNFGKSNRDVVLVGHSMGGIIVRETMYQMQINAGKSPFPPTIGHVTDAVTFNAPHSGTYLGIDLFACGACRQMAELNEFGDLMSDLKNHGQNPQTSGGFTRWTVIGSECDAMLRDASSSGIASAVDMHASHAVIYKKDSTTTTCYDHGGAIHAWEPKKLDAHLYYCDTSDPNNSPCGTIYNKGGEWGYMDNGPHSLLTMYDEIIGKAL